MQDNDDFFFVTSSRGAKSRLTHLAAIAIVACVAMLTILVSGVHAQPQPTDPNRPAEIETRAPLNPGRQPNVSYDSLEDRSAGAAPRIAVDPITTASTPDMDTPGATIAGSDLRKVMIGLLLALFAAMAFISTRLLSSSYRQCDPDDRSSGDA